MRRLRILALDGGGTLGLIEALILMDLERRVGKPAGKLFDLIAGTSTGGMIALALSTGNREAERIANLYRQKGQEIFGPSQRRFLGYVFGSKYSSDGLARAVEDFFGPTRLSAANPDVLVTAWDLDKAQPRFFKSREARERAAENYRMADVALATAAAPTYFPPARVANDQGAESHCWDGGLVANNPAMCALAEAMKHYDAPDVTLVSLGAGDSADGISPKAAARWGLLRTAPKVISVAIDGPMCAVDYQCRQMLGDRNYFRLNPPIDKATDTMDDATPGNIARIEAATRVYIAENNAVLDEIANQLKPRRRAA